MLVFRLIIFIYSFQYLTSYISLSLFQYSFLSFPFHSYPLLSFNSLQSQLEFLASFALSFDLNVFPLDPDFTPHEPALEFNQNQTEDYYLFAVHLTHEFEVYNAVDVHGVDPDPAHQEIQHNDHPVVFTTLVALPELQPPGLLPVCDCPLEQCEVHCQVPHLAVAGRYNAERHHRKLTINHNLTENLHDATELLACVDQIEFISCVLPPAQTLELPQLEGNGHYQTALLLLY